MKSLIAGLTLVLALNSASAQLISPESVQYSLLGAFIGGVAGGNQNHCGNYQFSSDGAAIGAGIGLVTGTVIGEARRKQAESTPTTYSTASGYGYYAPAPAPTTGSASASARPNYALGGTLVGAASGALIGEGSSGQAAEGAAIGAAAGLLVGGIAEHKARKQESAAQAKNNSTPANAQDKPPTIVAQSAQAPKASGPARQIPDAPRVPDARTF